MNILTNAWDQAEQLVTRERTEPEDEKVFLECCDFVNNNTIDVHSRYLVRTCVIPGMYYPNLPEGQLFDWLLEQYPQLQNFLLQHEDILSLVINRKDCPFSYWETKEILLLYNFDSCSFKRDGLGGKPTVD